MPPSSLPYESVEEPTNTYQERINLIYESGIGEWLEKKICLSGNARICEIGGGYGALALWFKHAFPQCSYTIIDLPESLLFSRLYLSLSLPDLSTSLGFGKLKHGVRFLPNYMAEKLDEPFDLCINTLSMSEMSRHQVQKYACMIKNKWLKDDGLFFEQNQNNKHMALLFAQEIFQPMFKEHLNLNDNGVTYRNGYPNIWSNKEIQLVAKHLPYKPVKVTLIEDIGKFNVVQVGNKFLCLRKSLGAIDVAKLVFKDAPPDIFSGCSQEEVKAKARCSGYLDNAL